MPEAPPRNSRAESGVIIVAKLNCKVLAAQAKAFTNEIAQLEREIKRNEAKLTRCKDALAAVKQKQVDQGCE